MPFKFLVRLHGENNTSLLTVMIGIISTDEDSGLRIESFAIINLSGVSTKLN